MPKPSERASTYSSHDCREILQTHYHNQDDATYSTCGVCGRITEFAWKTKPSERTGMLVKDHGQKIQLRGYDNPMSHMHGWPVQRRMDAWAFPLIEIFCEHGCGHPMPESVEWLEAHAKPGSKGTWSMHGCDGCCLAPKGQDNG